MARKEDAQPKDEYEFVPPDFDEEAFIHKEMISFRTTVILFFWGILAAGISFALFGPVGGAPGGWWLGLLLVTAMGFGLKFIFKVTKTDISHWARREWIGTGFLFFFTWLAFFILFINPPVSDYSNPEVNIYTSPGVQQVGSSVIVDVFLTDNDAVDTYTIRVDGPSGTMATEFAEIAKGHFRATIAATTEGSYTVNATATDGAGLTTARELEFLARAEVLEVSIRDLEAPQDSIFVRSAVEASNLHAVYLEMLDRTCADPNAEGERPCRVYLQYDEALGGWEATANMDGWVSGENTFRAVAEERNRFQGQTLVAGGRITNEGPFTVTVSAATGTYADHVPAPQPTKAPLRSTPGPELVLIIAGLVGLAVVARKR